MKDMFMLVGLKRGRERGGYARRSLRSAQNGPNPSHVRMKIAYVGNPAPEDRNLMPPSLSQATRPSSEYFNDSHSRVLTRHWLFHRASRPP